MKLDQTRLFEIIGVIAVVVSLLFVGMQLIFDREVAVAEQYFNRSESRIETVRSQFENEAFIDQLARQYISGGRPAFWSEELEDWLSRRIDESGEIAIRDMYRQSLLAELQVLGFDNIHYQYERGLITNEFWSGIENTIKYYMSRPIYRESYFLYIVRPGFLNELQRIEEELDSQSDT